MHCYFLLNIKHGASQFYLEEAKYNCEAPGAGGGLQLSSAGTVRTNLHGIAHRILKNQVSEFTMCRL